MARDSDQLADNLSTGHLGGWLTGFLAEEEAFDRPALWRLGSWGAGALGALIVAILASQSSVSQKREQIAAAELARQAQQIQTVAKDNDNSTRRLAAAIETLNSDRDRLYSRVTVLEQGLDTVTGTVARQQAPVTSGPVAAPQAAAGTPANQPATPVAATASTANSKPASPAADSKARPASVAAPEPIPPPVVAPVASVTSTLPAASTAPVEAAAAVTAPPPAPSPSLMASKSMMAPPDPAASKLSEPPAASSVPPPSPVVEPAIETVASVPAATEAAPVIAIQRTEFGVDLGGANSIDGLRALWRGLGKSNKELAALRPIIVVKERTNGLGMQLRLVAGPLNDAAAAAKLCAVLTESDRSCETTLFDGQRLAVKGEASKSDQAKGEQATTPPPPPPVRSTRRYTSKRAKPVVEQRSQKPEEPVPNPRSSLQSFLGMR